MKKVLLASVSAVVLGFAGTAAAQTLSELDSNISDGETTVVGDIGPGDVRSDTDLDGSTGGVNTLYQGATNFVGTSDEQLIDDDYDSGQTFNDAFQDIAGVAGAWNSGINAGQQGGVAAGVDAGAEDTVGANVALQEVSNTIALSDEDLIETTYNSDLNFSNNAFNGTTLATGAWNSGINAGQQGGVAASASVNAGGTVVAANTLAQVVSNTISDVQSVTDPQSTYNATMSFTTSAFDNTALATGAFNTGLNAVQQGAVAVAGSSSTLP